VIRRLPGNVAKTPGVAQFAVTCVFSLFLKVKSDNFPTRQSYKSIIQEAPCELEHTHIHTPAKHTETHTERHTHTRRDTPDGLIIAAVLRRRLVWFSFQHVYSKPVVDDGTNNDDDDDVRE
jgi:hypothetical protein